MPSVRKSKQGHVWSGAYSALVKNTHLVRTYPVYAGVFGSRLVHCLRFLERGFWLEDSKFRLCGAPKGAAMTGLVAVEFGLQTTAARRKLLPFAGTNILQRRDGAQALHFILTWLAQNSPLPCPQSPRGCLAVLPPWMAKGSSLVPFSSTWARFDDFEKCVHPIQLWSPPPDLMDLQQQRYCLPQRALGLLTALDREHLCVDAIFVKICQLQVFPFVDLNQQESWLYSTPGFVALELKCVMNPFLGFGWSD
ncbi:hypothetical protein DFH06DRAFT_1321237 [Mycena polygramma]|nr:hypothetical protein DFH06DRAFT_1321237 [Mycena polygramma]